MMENCVQQSELLTLVIYCTVLTLNNTHMETNNEGVIHLRFSSFTLLLHLPGK